MTQQLSILVDRVTLGLVPRLRIAAPVGALAMVLPLLMAATGYMVKESLPPTYSAMATVRVGLFETGGLFANQVFYENQNYLLPDALDAMIRSPAVLTRADLSLARAYPGYRVNPAALKTQLDQPDLSTNLVDITVRDGESQRATDAANAVASAFVGRARELIRLGFAPQLQQVRGRMGILATRIDQLSHAISTYSGPAGGDAALQSELRQARTSYADASGGLAQIQGARATAVTTVALAFPASSPASALPRHAILTALGLFLLGMLISLAFLYIYRRMHDLPRSVEEIAAAAGARLLGTVERFDATPRPAADVPSAVAEEYRMVRTSLLFGNREGQARAILVTSAFPGEGKSTTALNLARVFSRGSGRTTLIDADLRKPSLHRAMPGIAEAEDGLVSLLAGGTRGGGMHETDIPDLLLVPAGRSVPTPMDWLASPAMRRTVERFGEDGIVIIDSPPVLSVPDAAILAATVDGVVLVVDPHSTSRRDIRRARQIIEMAGGAIVGVVVNRMEPGGLSRRPRFHRYSHHRRGNSQAA